MNFFDLHCDTATEAMKIRAGLRGSGLQLDLDRWQGGSLCQSYAVFIPDTLRGEPAWKYLQPHCIMHRVAWMATALR